jgi:hypothetical protein
VLEYYNKLRYLTTGKSISFRIPREYMGNYAEVNGGVPFELTAVYRRIGTTWQQPVSRPGQKSPPLDYEVLSVSAFWSGPYPLSMDAPTWRGLPDVPGAGFEPQLVRQSFEWCGFDVYEVKNSDQRLPIIVSPLKPAPEWKYTAPMLFARPEADKHYHLFITCSDYILTSGYPSCVMRTLYRGWPMEVMFYGGKICEADAMVATATAFLDRFRAGETARAPGYPENRYDPPDQ